MDYGVVLSNDAPKRGGGGGLKIQGPTLLFTLRFSAPPRPAPPFFFVDARGASKVCSRCYSRELIEVEQENQNSGYQRVFKATCNEGVYKPVQVRIALDYAL